MGAPKPMPGIGQGGARAPGERDTGGQTRPSLSERHQQLRLLEALLFAAAEPLDEASLASRLPEGADLPSLLEELAAIYANRGVHLARSGRKWAFRTAPDMAPFLRTEKAVARRLSSAAVETLAIIAYHQPVTRAEIEEVRGRSLSRGTLDVLLEAGWVRPRGRRRTPGRPVTWGTTDAFLDHFGLESLDDLPGIEEMKAAGLLDSRPAIAAYGPRPAGSEAPAQPGESGAGDAGAEQGGGPHAPGHNGDSVDPETDSVAAGTPSPRGEDPT